MTTLFLILLLAQPIVTDLGVMTPNRAIALEPCTNRADFLHFVVELKAASFWTNYHQFVTTNRLLTMDDFASMPPGPIAMGVRSVCQDGEESPISLFRLDIRRDPPKPPKASAVHLGAHPSRQSLTNAFRSLHANPVEPPPAPGTTNKPTGGPLPNGRPETYSDHMIAMQKFWSEHNEAKRRNQ